VAPVLWSGLVYTILGLLNPLLASHIDWFWFVVSQMAFGIVAGNVVVRQASIPTRENMALLCAQGLKHLASLHHEKPGETPVNRVPYLCLTGLLSMLLSRLRHSSWATVRRFRNPWRRIRF